jgi:hypothetical protein
MTNKTTPTTMPMMVAVGSPEEHEFWQSCKVVALVAVEATHVLLEQTNLVGCWQPEPQDEVGKRPVEPEGSSLHVLFVSQ